MPRPMSRLALALVAFLGASGAVAVASAPSSGATTRAETRAAGPGRAGLERSFGTAFTLTGAGSTFDAPFFTKAFYQYEKERPGVTVDYAAIGSSGGIQQFQQGIVDFGASDVPMSPSAVAETKGGPVLQVPVDLGGEAISYNLPGVRARLRITGTLLADIFLGRIDRWDDPRLKAENPRAALPDEAITVVHRSDGSGTTYIFTSFLSTTSPRWARGPGYAKSINWPVGVGGQGNQGVAGLVQQIPGAIGYVELAYALEDHFRFFAVQNRAGRYVVPSPQSVAADAAQKAQVSARSFSIVDEPGASSYPIAGYSWLLVHERAAGAARGRALQALLGWLTGKAQPIASSLNYVALPGPVRSEAAAVLGRMVGPNGRRLS